MGKNKLDGIYSEGMRYLENAASILDTKAKRIGDVYTDKKYVRMAGHTAYSGVLVALESAGLVRHKKRHRLDVKDYQEALAARNKKMLNYFNECYEQLHLVAGYDGYGHRKHLQISFNTAQEIIRWAAAQAA